MCEQGNNPQTEDPEVNNKQKSETELTLDALKFYASTHRQLHQQRRQFEFRLFLTTLSFYVLSAASIGAGRVQLPGGWWLGIGISLVFLVLAFVASVALFRMHISNHVNVLAAEAAEDRILGLMKHNPKNFIKDNKPASWLFRFFYFMSKDSDSSEGPGSSRAGAPPYFHWLWQFLLILVLAMASAGFIVWTIVSPQVDSGLAVSIRAPFF